MYRYSNGQISLSDFKQLVGMHLKKNNRWVKRHRPFHGRRLKNGMPRCFRNRKGNVAKSPQLALEACIIRAEYGYSDEEITLQIQENPYLQYFCGYPGYDDERSPFGPSLMVYFRKRLTLEILGEINEMTIQDAKERQEKEDDNDGSSSGSGNSGTFIVEATYTPSNIRYP